MIKKLYRFILKVRWGMSRNGANLCGGVFLADYVKHKRCFLKVHAIHQKGFSWDDWHVAQLTNKTYSEYLKTTEYYGMHPLNGEYSHWIDDKLTLKYLCAGTPLDQYMPKYYYQVTDNGTVLPLPDAPSIKKRAEFNDIVNLLEIGGELAIKRIAGSLGEGFYKAVYQDHSYFLNGQEFTRELFTEKLAGLKGYLITEYLHPHKDLAYFCANTANCLRYLVGRNEDGKMMLIKSYIRFGTKVSGFVENYGAGGVLCFISEDGSFKNGNLLDLNRRKNQTLTHHPDTKVELTGKIPCWGEIQHASDLFGQIFPQMDYLGIDFVVTDKNEVKVLEINSLTSLDALQMQGSILNEPQGKFFRRRLKR